MADVNAQLVAKLREKSGARMMDCKKALVETQAEAAKGEGPWLAAAETWLRTKSLDKGHAMAERTATEGMLAHKLSPDGKTLTVVEMTANTDFVTKNAEFLKLLNDLLELADTNALDSAEKLAAQTLNGTPVAEAVKALAGKIGENIGIKRVVRYQGEIGYYIHHDSKQGAIVELTGVSGEKAQALGKELAMHIVFAKPAYLTREEVPADLVKKETEIVAERLKNDPRNATKPPEILQKIAAGQLGKFYASFVLPDQPYFRDSKITVAQVMKEQGGAAVKRFVRFQVGAA
ncbi:MAG: translation elongation factor Ts [Planctomycetota bacterium]|nr:translation elongation factor Ts [Planctomycetota bacterium]